MTVRLRARAQQDIEAALDYYVAEAGDNATQDLAEALRQAVSRLGRHPKIGSSRYAEALNLPGLRSWPVRKFPFVIFYSESRGQVEIWRVLHGHRDLPDELPEEGGN